MRLSSVYHLLSPPVHGRELSVFICNPPGRTRLSACCTRSCGMRTSDWRSSRRHQIGSRTYRTLYLRSSKAAANRWWENTATGSLSSTRSSSPIFGGGESTTADPCRICSALCGMRYVQFLPSRCSTTEPRLTMACARAQSHHRNELPDDVKTQLGESSQSLLDYFTDKFPRLFLHVYDVVSSSAIRIEPTFRRYF